MLGIIWNDFLYRPLFNVLIWLYNNWTGQNLGLAVVYLTIGLRILLLPFTIVGERDKIKNAELEVEVEKLEKDFRHDPVLRKEEIRKVAKRRKVHPWAKAVVLGIQLLVLVLLYQVFIRGITGEKLIKFLYNWVDFPGSINIMFFGFNLGQTHDIIWPGIVGLFLLAEIYLGYRHRKGSITKSDLFYFLLFPAASFFLLWMLPMVKSLFILTSLVFSLIVHQFVKLGVKKPDAGKK
ncbi:MAG: YidC/Oxa1 family membrane protein insertase [Candidatus Magasanikbacteria bacterium]